MGVCYVCGKTLIRRPDDYKENRKKYIGQAIAHEEHIIQNAIYGRLKSNKILCEECGGNLGGDIDADFCNLFSSFTERLRPILASKDHGSNSFQKSLNGYLFKNDGSKLDVRIKGGKVVATKPDYEYIEHEQMVNIFSTQKIAKYYKHKVISELKKNGVNIKNLKVKIIDDLSSYGDVGFHFSEGNENFNDKFKMGFNKIAMGFAMSKGIDRSAVPRIFNINTSTIIFTDNIVPFYPFGALELVIEPFRTALEDGYPTHTLILFTEKNANSNRLICYIDLFSTFQYYVILNEEYEGNEILEHYSQTILKQELPDIDIRANRWKHLLTLAEELDIKQSEFFGKPMEEVFDLLETKKRQRTVNYKRDIVAYFSTTANRVIQSIMLRKVNYLGHLSEEEKQIIQSMPDLSKDDLLSIQADLQRIKTDFFYRRNYIEYTENNGLVIRPTVSKMIEISNLNQKLFVSYGHFKFFQLSQFIEQKEFEMDN